jgi:hypothetical protein
MSEDFGAWKRHFINQARGLIPHQNSFYKVREQKGGGGGGEQNIKLVTPTQQVVERAKSTISDPPVVYDPVTGITNQPLNESIKTTQKRKRQNCKCKAKKQKRGDKKSNKKKMSGKGGKKRKGKGNGKGKGKLLGRGKSNKTTTKKRWYENI